MTATMDLRSPSIITMPKINRTNLTKRFVAASLRKKSSRTSKSTRQVITTGAGHVFSTFVCRVTVRPNKQLTLPIGNTFTGATPKGFSIGLSPGNGIEESVNMDVTAHAVDKNAPSKLEYKLHITNDGKRTICAEVWAL